MPAVKISVEEFITLGLTQPVLDVRSPGEYHHAHIPGALSLPLFDDEERKKVGTTYKQVGRQDAIKIGLDYFGPRMRQMVEYAEGLSLPLAPSRGGGSVITQTSDNTSTTTSPSLRGRDGEGLLVHCWRGGMRSGAVAWLLDLYGFKVHLLDGGYKAFRNWVLQQFLKDYNFQLIGGYTGSGKTLVLEELKQRGEAILDLEGLAKHKGSAFGNLERDAQPSSEMFENMIAMELFRLTKDNPEQLIWVEDESQRIGQVNMPIQLWNRFREKPLYFLNVPFEQRLHHIVKDYGKHSKESLINAIVRIQKRLGGLETKTAINCLIENDTHGCFEVLLKYYDKQYSKALNNRPDTGNVTIPVETNVVQAATNADKILSHATANG